MFTLIFCISPIKSPDQILQHRCFRVEKNLDESAKLRGRIHEKQPTCIMGLCTTFNLSIHHLCCSGSQGLLESVGHWARCRNTTWTHTHTLNVHVFGLRQNSSWRKPTQPRGEHAHSTQNLCTTMWCKWTLPTGIISLSSHFLSCFQNKLLHLIFSHVHFEIPTWKL